MESVRVRGCVVRDVLGGKPMPVAGKTAHVRSTLLEGGLITVRLRRKSCLGPVVRHGGHREKVGSGTELREPQQATVGTKTRSAGRTPSPAHPRALTGPGVMGVSAG